MCMGENKMDKRKEKSIGEVLSEHEKEREVWGRY